MLKFIRIIILIYSTKNATNNWDEVNLRYSEGTGSLIKTGGNVTDIKESELMPLKLMKSFLLNLASKESKYMKCLERIGDT